MILHETPGIGQSANLGRTGNSRSHSDRLKAAKIFPFLKCRYGPQDDLNGFPKLSAIESCHDAPSIPSIKLGPMFRDVCCAALLLASCVCARAQWDIEPSNTTADLRGIHSIGNGIAWAS